MRKVTITMYRWSGKKYGISIKNECKECEINTAMLEDMKQKEFHGKPVTIEIKPWLTHLWESLSYGGWHAPVMVVNGKLVSQGVVIDRSKLTTLILKIINH